MTNELGKHNGETVYCPVNGWDCPYYKKGVCMIDNPVENCTDFSDNFPTWKDWEDT